MNKLQTLQEKLDYHFRAVKHLRCALTHKSACQNHYEKLEFLGDSVLNYCISSLLFSTLQDLDEGKLSIFRSKLVSKATLSKVGKTLDVDNYIRSENQSVSLSIRADVVEAIIGAIYIDAGIQSCQTVIATLFNPIIEDLMHKDLKDAKSHLQELMHKQNHALPKYSVVKTSGQSHNLIYTIACEAKKQKTEAQASSKRQAEMHAAEKMLSLLQEKEPHE